MSLEDSNPHRRNLVVTACAFIVYFMADGQFADDKTISLSILSLKFHDTFWLGFFAWLALFYFMYRFYLDSKEGLKGFWSNYNYILHKRWYFPIYFKKRMPENLLDFQLGTNMWLNGVSKTQNTVVINYNLDQGTVIARNLAVSYNGEIKLEGALGAFVKYASYVDYFISHEKFMDYIMPYFLVLFAILSWA